MIYIYPFFVDTMFPMTSIHTAPPVDIPTSFDWSRHLWSHFCPQKHIENIVNLRRIAFGTDSDMRKQGSSSANDYKKLGFMVGGLPAPVSAASFCSLCPLQHRLRLNLAIAVESCQNHVNTSCEIYVPTLRLQIAASKSYFVILFFD